MHLLPAPADAEHPVLSWLEGTALRPVRAALDDAGLADFRAELGVRLARGVPGTAGSGVLPVPPDLRRRPHRRPCRGEPVTDLPTFIAELPKVELHVHHVGSASPRIVAELAARHEGRSPVPADPEALADYFAFRDFAHFIEVYLSVVDLIRDPEDVWLLTHEVARELARQQVRYAELTVTPYSHVRRGIPAPAFCEAIEDARKTGRGRLRHRAALVLRHPRRGRPAGRRGDPADRARGAPRRAGQLRPRRPRDRGAPAAVQAVLRPGAGGRAALRAARRGDHRPADRLGRPARAGRRADRPRHLRRAGPGAARPPRRAAHPAGGLPDLQRAHPGRRPHRGAPAAAAGRGRASWSPSTPTTRRCSAPPSTTSTRSPPGCSTPVPRGSRHWPGTAVSASFLDPAGQAADHRRDRRLRGDPLTHAGQSALRRPVTLGGSGVHAAGAGVGDRAPAARTDPPAGGCQGRQAGGTDGFGPDPVSRRAPRRRR